MIYEVTGAERDRLLALARESGQPGWWETGNTGLPSQLTALIGFESQAIRITDVQLVLIPGLLQTPEYTRAVIQSCGEPPLEVETRVATRMGRQAALSRPDPPEFLAIIDEAVLRRPVGSRAVMGEQLRHVVKITGRPNVTVQVIPYHRGAHTGLDGSYVILEFAKARNVVHLEHKRSGIFLDEPEDVDAFVAGVDTLRGVALDPPSRRSSSRRSPTRMRGEVSMNLSRVAWRKSSRSGSQSNCVEVATATDTIAVRDSKDPGGPALAFAPAAWGTFLARAKTGVHDLH